MWQSELSVLKLLSYVLYCLPTVWTGNELSSLTWSHDLVFQFYQLSNIQQDSIAEKDERLGNVSRQLQSLQMQNRRLIETLQHVAVKLCRELYNKSGGEHALSSQTMKTVLSGLEFPIWATKTMYFLEVLFLPS